MVKPLSQLAHEHLTTLWDQNSLERAFAYVARCLIFVAYVLVIASSLVKIVDMHTIQTRPTAIQIIAMQHMNISTDVLLRFV